MTARGCTATLMACAPSRVGGSPGETAVARAGLRRGAAPIIGAGLSPRPVAVDVAPPDGMEEPPTLADRRLLGAYPGSFDRLLISGPPTEKFAIRYVQAHFLRPNETEFITPRPLSLFSWAGFMAEVPVKPKVHSRKPQPSRCSSGGSTWSKSGSRSAREVRALFIFR